MRVKKILFPTDFSDCARHAVDYAIMMARKFQASLDLLYVDEASYLMNPVNIDLQADVSFVTDEIRKVVEDKLRDWVRLFPKEIPVRVAIEMGKPHLEIVEIAKKHGVDLILMGTHGRGSSNYFLGSNAERVVRLSPCPVITVREARKKETVKKILFPVDFSDLCKRVCPQVIALAREFGAELHFLHVSISFTHETRAFVNDAFKKFLLDLDLSGITYFTDSYEAFVENTGINEYAHIQDIDLIAIGTHGRTGIKRLIMGSVTEEVVNTSFIPVLTLRSFNTQIN
ncbi:universal stress protein [bacterium]|nr:universal stress protein [bacterium]